MDFITTLLEKNHLQRRSIKIEKKMKEIVDRNEITKREVWDRNKAISHFKKKGEIYKAS
ncbi:MAG: hypothetical protein CM1200mP13_04500 [Candidatus Pelagibacterales bacterium]|nr:MAG: hypothetical protein CM1200mP13_04500 [Pelagibacterales bacterium]